MDWQLWISVLLVALAALHLARVGWQMLRRPPQGKACGTCGDCTGPPDAPIRLVGLRPPESNRESV